MCRARSLFASSMKGRFSVSVNNFHSPPSLLLISLLCILGFSWAIFRLWPLDHTMKAFIGLFTLLGSLLSSKFFEFAPLILLLWGGVGEGPSSWESWERVGDDFGI